MKLYLLLPVVLALAVLAYPISSLSQTVDEDAQIGTIPGDIIPDDITPTQVGNVDSAGVIYVTNKDDNNIVKGDYESR